MSHEVILLEPNSLLAQLAVNVGNAVDIHPLIGIQANVLLMGNIYRIVDYMKQEMEVEEDYLVIATEPPSQPGEEMTDRRYRFRLYDQGKFVNHRLKASLDVVRRNQQFSVEPPLSNFLPEKPLSERRQKIESTLDHLEFHNSKQWDNEI